MFRRAPKTQTIKSANSQPENRTILVLLNFWIKIFEQSQTFQTLHAVLLKFVVSQAIHHELALESVAFSKSAGSDSPEKRKWVML